MRLTTVPLQLPVAGCRLGIDSSQGASKLYRQEARGVELIPSSSSSLHSRASARWKWRASFPIPSHRRHFRMRAMRRVFCDWLVIQPD